MMAEPFGFDFTSDDIQCDSDAMACAVQPAEEPVRVNHEINQHPGHRSRFHTLVDLVSSLYPAIGWEEICREHSRSGFHESVLLLPRKSFLPSVAGSSDKCASFFSRSYRETIAKLSILDVSALLTLLDLNIAVQDIIFYFANQKTGCWRHQDTLPGPL